VLFVAICSLSGVLFVIEYNTRYLDVVRQGFSYISDPILFVANLPIKSVNATTQYFGTHDHLTDRIDLLNRQLLEMYGVAQQYSSLKNRYEELQKVLAVQVGVDYEMQLVEIVGLVQDFDRQLAVINVGSNDGIEIDMVVIAPTGVYGRVLDVQHNTSTVITIFDKRHALPVTVKRSGLNTTAAGNGIGGMLSLEHIHRRSNIKETDLIVTSGIGGVFLPGFEVGKVVFTQESATESLIRVDVQSSVTYDSERYVYVILGVRQSG